MRPDVKDFPSLIRYIADRHHRGVIQHVGPSFGMSPATGDKWVKNNAKQPQIDSLLKLCERYGYDLNWVIGLVQATAAKRRAGRLAIILALSIGGVLSATRAQALDLMDLPPASYRKRRLALA